MMKKIVLGFFLMLVLLFGLYYAKNKFYPVTPEENPTTAFEDQFFSYQKDNLSPACPADSAIFCAVDQAVKCTLNPDFEGCRATKLPKFIFMEDESLGRPTEISFKIVKLKPISADLVEIHTQSTCNGNWFGLCQGYVIYVLVPTTKEGEWRVKDVYAMTE